jgi:hypothetical protein
MKRALATGFVAGFVIAVLALALARSPDDVAHNSAAAGGSAETAAIAARAALSCDPELRQQASTLDIDAADLRLPESFHDRVVASTVVMHQTWGRWLDDAALAPAPVRLRFVTDVAQFADLYMGPVPKDADTSGFYRMRDNEAVVLYSPYRRQDTLATTLHELSHLFTAWHLGSTPAWLNEGLAEHFETLNRRGEFYRSAEHIVVLRRDGPTPLETLLTLRRSEFARQEPRRHYASAWALVTFLLENENGRATLEGLLREAHTQRCATARTQLAGLHAYPGGIDSLENDWAAWVRSL